MSRLTEKNRYGYHAHQEYGYHCEELRKLGELEDIEDELGIDLVTLFKALKYGIYFADVEPELVPVQLRMFYEEPMLVHEASDDVRQEVFVAGYGVSWALTKEELE